MRVWVLAGIFAVVAVSQTAIPSELELIEVIDLKGQVHHSQGIEVSDSGSRLWVTSVNSRSKKGYLHEFVLKSGAHVRTLEIQDGGRFHPGGIAADRGALWIPVAEYRRKSTAVVQKRNLRTLELEYQFEVPDHIGCIAVNSDILVGGNWDSLELYIWDHRGNLQSTVPNVTGNAFQDIKFDGATLVGSGLLAGRAGAIDWLAFPSMKPLRRLSVGQTDRGQPFTREGMAIRDGRLYLLPEDGPTRLFVFSLKR